MGEVRPAERIGVEQIRQVTVEPLDCGCEGWDIWCDSHAEIKRLMSVFDGRDGNHIVRVALSTHQREIEELEQQLADLRAQQRRIGIAAFLTDAMSLEEIAQCAKRSTYAEPSKWVSRSRRGWPPVPKNRLDIYRGQRAAGKKGPK